MYSRYAALVLFMVHRLNTLNRLKRGGATLLIDVVHILLYTELWFILS